MYCDLSPQSDRLMVKYTGKQWGDEPCLHFQNRYPMATAIEKSR